MGRQVKPENAGQVKFDLGTAKEIAESFSVSCGVQCAVTARDGACLEVCRSSRCTCEVCHRLSNLTGENYDCARLHNYGAFQSERFGGRYIYFCPIGLAFFASPIIIGGLLEGALIGGPMLIMDEEDFLSNDALRLSELPPETTAQLRAELRDIPRCKPKVLDKLSFQLFANAVYISDSTHELFRRREENETQNLLGDYISRLKQSDQPAAYPIEKEHEIYTAISRGDRQTASTLLNELLGYLFFRCGEPEVIRTRITELLVVLSRAAISGGASAEQILNITKDYLQEMRLLHTQEELTRWLAGSLKRFTNLVFNILEGNHTNAMRSAVGYIREHYAERLTLEAVAAEVGYSPSYFSRIFREEVGSTFKEFLVSCRIERSKHLLLSGDDSISDICSVVGFTDQSYFCKIFREHTGTTPDKYRKRVRRIDPGKERTIEN